MSEVTFEAFAYLPKYVEIDAVRNGEELPAISLCDNDGWYAKEGYPKIGTVKVTIDLHSADNIVQQQIEALNVELQNERAKSQQRQNAILNQISKLQALTFSEAS